VQSLGSATHRAKSDSLRAHRACVEGPSAGSGCDILAGLSAHSGVAAKPGDACLQALDAVLAEAKRRGVDAVIWVDRLDVFRVSSIDRQA